MEKLQVDVEALRRQGTPDKKEQEGSILVTEEKSRSFPQKERGKERRKQSAFAHSRTSDGDGGSLLICRTQNSSQNGLYPHFHKQEKNKEINEIFFFKERM